ncbi:MAG: hypothetical protein ACHQXL_04510, partial [Candidatus Limnocylindrales bacterium]
MTSDRGSAATVEFEHVSKVYGPAPGRTRAEPGRGRAVYLADVLEFDRRGAAPSAAHGGRSFARNQA